ncbi:DUF456 domain-containing protein [Alkalicoccus saliphilus]|jgi:uncharacterized protein|uniref:DUF456 domain-containing protein n=1 Tax=Alkalicoccus saliphilus TaxID=200989 RepID=A0A2T4U9Y4_9BACI|nr:DUF456 family protein [Alkalicoccus saliphilus]PTL40216.1 DUF456 domain-containing protein [Alkalicoccus saliphilus]
MEVLVWTIIAALFVLSFIGLLYPIIPSVLLIWAAVILYAVLIDGGAVSWWMWSSLVLLTLVLFVTDYAASMFFVKKYGSSRHGTTAATVGLIAGMFIIPPFGIFIVPFLLVLMTELAQKKPLKESAKAAVGTLFGFLAGSFAKGLLQGVLIALFMADVLIFV